MQNIKPKLSNKSLSRARALRKNQTPQEIIIWSRLRAKRFHNLKFRRQYPLGKYVIDFVCLEKKLVIEIDGSQHKEGNHKNYDAERSKFLESLGFKVLRFWNNEVNNNLDGVFLKIYEVVE